MIGGKALVSVESILIIVGFAARLGDGRREPRFFDLAFQGPVVRLALAAGDRSPVVAHVGPDQQLPLLRPGDPVHIGWAPEAALILPGVPEAPR